MIFSSVTVPVNPRGARPLTRDEVWAGLVLKARDPQPFVPPGTFAHCKVVTEGKNFVIHECALWGEDITQFVSLMPKRKISFHQAVSHREGVIVNEIIENEPGELQLRYYAILALVGVEPGSEMERRERMIIDSEDLGLKASALKTLEHIRELSAAGAL